MQDVRHVSQDAVGAAQVSQPSTMFSNFARGEKGNDETRKKVMHGTGDEDAKDGASASLSRALGGQFLGTVTLEVAGNVATSFPALNKSCWVVRVLRFVRTRSYLKVETQ